MIFRRLRASLVCGLAAAWLAAGMPRVEAAGPAAAIAVPLPLTGTRDTQVKSAIMRRLDDLRRPGGDRGVLVLEFRTSDDAGAVPSDFGRALDLARFLGDERLAGVKTVAYLPEGARGHAVLVALACEEIVMPAEAVLGPANAEEPAVDDAMRAGYAQVAARRRTVPPALALALVDPEARILRVTTDGGERFVADRELDAVRREAAVLAVEEIGPAPLELVRSGAHV